MSNHTPYVLEISMSSGISTIVDELDADMSAYRWRPIGTARLYARANAEGKTVLLHRLILQRVLSRALGRWEFVDHIDGDTLNNCRSNLRLATNAENLRNRHRHKNNQCGYKGVYVAKDRGRTSPWRAQISVGGKQIRLGYFATPELAYEAYCKAAQELHGKFARLE